MLTKTLFTEILKDEQILEQEPLSKHTTFKIGGPCSLMLLPNYMEEVKAAVKICRANGRKFFVMGNGSNLLAKDEGYDGVIIKIAKNMRLAKYYSGNKVYAQAGISLAALANFSLQNSLSGLEFASGIPGTLGGALYMNAGAYGEEMAGVTAKVFVINEQGDYKWIAAEDCAFGYRTSRMEKENLVVLAALLNLGKGKQEDIRAKMTELNQKRTESQPLTLPSAGSTFKRPVGYFAGKLIQDCGLRGFAIGGAAVSEKHCGFIVNNGNATSEDVLRLIEHVRNTVKKNFGVDLQPEVKILE